MLETIKPMDIEKRSFEIITGLLGDRRMDPVTGGANTRDNNTTPDLVKWEKNR